MSTVAKDTEVIDVTAISDTCHQDVIITRIFGERTLLTTVNSLQRLKDWQRYCRELWEILRLADNGMHDCHVS